jgi:hypothetical protein
VSCNFSALNLNSSLSVLNLIISFLASMSDTVSCASELSDRCLFLRAGVVHAKFSGFVSRTVGQECVARCCMKLSFRENPTSFWTHAETVHRNLSSRVCTDWLWRRRSLLRAKAPAQSSTEHLNGFSCVLRCFLKPQQLLAQSVLWLQLDQGKYGPTHVHSVLRRKDFPRQPRSSQT